MDKLLLVFASIVMTAVSSDERVFQVPENTPPGRFISNLKKEFNIPYDVVPYFVPKAPSMNYDEYFELDRTTGIFRTKKTLDREYVCGFVWPRNPCNFSFVLLVMSETHDVTVEITDVNDNAPKFSKQSIKLAIPESEFVGLTYDLCRVTDEDLGMNSLLKIKSQTQSEFFEVSGTSKSPGTLELSLHLRKKLDREEQKTHQLLVTVEDSGEPALSSYVTVQIDVTDVNDNPPVFENNGRFTVQIPENTRLGSTVTTLVATDKDEGPNGRVMYEVFNTDSTTRDTFVVGTMTGDIGLIKKLDYETTRRYEMRVVANDMGRPSLSATATVIFEVLDSNDNPPMISLTYLSMKSYGEIVENKFLTSRDRNESLVAVVSVTDDDKTEENNVVTCFTTDDRFSLVKYTRSSQLLITDKLFDREEEAWVNFKLICRDNGQPTLEAIENIKIKVLDINDNSPAFEQSVYSVSIDENSSPGQVVMQVVASDADEGDNGTVVYAIEGDDHLTIHGESGLVSMVIPYDREAKGEHRYQITATDKGFPFSLSSTSTLIINVNDVDEAPYFSKNSFHFRILENEPSMTVVGKLEAIDLDQSDAFKSFTYNIERQEANYFEIDDDGTLFSIISLDREISSSHSLQVCARSSNDRRLQSCTNVTVSVDDLNDNVPFFVSPQICNSESLKNNKLSDRVAQISRHSSAGTEIATFVADDPDLTPDDFSIDRHRFSFSLVETFPQNLKDELHLDEYSGKLSVSGGLAKFPPHSLEIIVQVSENRLPSHNSRCNFKFDLTNETIAESLVSSLTSLDDKKFLIVVISASASAGIVLILVTAITVVICRSKRRRNGMKGQPVRPDLIQNNRKSADFAPFRDSNHIGGLSPGLSSTLTINTFPTLSTFTKEPILGTPDSNIISYLSLKKGLPSDTSSGCSSAREEMMSLMTPNIEVTNGHDNTPRRAMPPIYNPAKHSTETFPLSLNLRLERERFSIPNRVTQRDSQSPRVEEAAVGSLEEGNYIRYNDLY